MPKPKNIQPEKKGKEDFCRKILAHVANKEKIGLINKNQAKFTAAIKEEIEKFGTANEVGSITFFEEFSGVTVKALNSARLSTSLVPEASDILKANKIGKKFVTQAKVDVIDEEALQSAIAAGKISLELAEKLYVTNKTFALTTSVGTIDPQMPTVQED